MKPCIKCATPVPSVPSPQIGFTQPQPDRDVAAPPNYCPALHHRRCILLFVRSLRQRCLYLLNSDSFIQYLQDSTGISSVKSATMAHIFRGARPILNASASRQFTASFARNAARTTRRFQSTSSEAQQATKDSWFKSAWNSPIGLKTVHFW